VQFWTGTNAGLCRFDEEAPASRGLRRGDGLAGTEVNGGAFLVTSTGEFVVGGMKGLSVFRPEDAPHRGSRRSGRTAKESLRDSRPRVALSGVEVLGRPRLFVAPPELVLTHRENVLTLTVSVLAFRRPDRNLIEYQLDGFDESFVKVRPRERANVTYTNLKPGRYVFRMKGAGAGGVFEEATPLAIRVLPPPWATGWAYVLYAILSFLAGAGVVRFRTPACRPGSLRVDRRRENGSFGKQQELSRRGSSARRARPRRPRRPRCARTASRPSSSPT
jgi:hypothetical protein